MLQNYDVPGKIAGALPYDLGQAERKINAELRKDSLTDFSIYVGAQQNIFSGLFTYWFCTLTNPANGV